VAGTVTAKPEGYYAVSRTDGLAELAPPLGRVLDLGCGEGAHADVLRRAGAAWISGVEIVPEAAARAALVYDEVVEGSVEELLGETSGPFDTVLAYDVLEHLVDPASVIASLRDHVTTGARLHVSLPNARHWTLVRDLVLRGTFGYTASGHRDATHLRWFTLGDARLLLSQHGWTVERVSHDRLRPLSALAARLTRGLSAEFLVYQYRLLARAP
jgi:SAM-dependent methyltransferase